MYKIGVDEAGRGPAIGPLVVCALCIPESEIEILESIGADDSKLISRKKRDLLSSEILIEAEKRKWSIGMVVCDADRIDRERKKINLNQLEIELFKEAINLTDMAANKGVILADACDVNEQRFEQRVKSVLGEKWGHWKVDAKHKMDSKEIVVGAASILAKVCRDKEINRINDLLDVDIGSGYPSDPKTKNAVKKLVNDELPNQFLRWSWATVKNAWNEVHGTQIPIRQEIDEIRIQSSLNDW
jgi:ribonuclease HII|tara:strand:- start:8684 stop:9412 length:729 start_codon:yes stop_codon:yes gene_type:complete